VNLLTLFHKRDHFRAIEKIFTIVKWSSLQKVSKITPKYQPGAGSRGLLSPLNQQHGLVNFTVKIPCYILQLTCEWDEMTSHS
jgi:hypothetical protein